MLRAINEYVLVSMFRHIICEQLYEAVGYSFCIWQEHSFYRNMNKLFIMGVEKREEEGTIYASANTNCEYVLTPMMCAGL